MAPCRRFFDPAPTLPQSVLTEMEEAGLLVVEARYGGPMARSSHRATAGINNRRNWYSPAAHDSGELHCRRCTTDRHVTMRGHRQRRGAVDYLAGRNSRCRRSEAGARTAEPPRRARRAGTQTALPK